MATVVDICNLALADLGDSATVSSIEPPEGSPQAEQCARFYPIARDFLLEMYPWKFATYRVQLALLLVTEQPTQWHYAYAEPSDALKLLSVYEAEAINDWVTYGRLEPQPFVREVVDVTDEAVIYTNVEDAVLRYTARITDPTRFPPIFTRALTKLLASYLAGPIFKGETGTKVAREMEAAAFAIVGQAMVSDANQQREQVKHVPSALAARGATFDPDYWPRTTY